MTDDSLFLIDIDKILRAKAPKRYKYIPKFLISYLKKIVHQEEINVFLQESKDKLGVDFLEASLDFLDAKVEVREKKTYLKRDYIRLYRIIHWADRMEWLWAMFSVNSTMER